jgi:hypothetical protein
MQKILITSSREMEFTTEAVLWVQQKYPDFFRNPNDMKVCKWDMMYMLMAEPDNKVLIECFECLGSDKTTAWGRLQIIEIPDGINWEIAYDYEGKEYVAEQHRKWTWQNLKCF